MITEFPVPVMGERNDVPDNELPVTAMRTCQNMVRNERGRLAIRPGYTPSSPIHPTDRVMGVAHFRLADATDQMVCGTLTKLWAYNNSSGNWEDKTGTTALSGSLIDHVRFVIMPVAGVYNAIAMNGINTMQIWDGTAPTFIDIVGTPPIGIAGAVCANRLLVLVKPNIVRVSDFNNPNIWPVGGGFTIQLVDAGDLMVGMEQLTRTSVAVLGEESQWVLSAQTGSIPIRAERISNFPGPLSAAAIVRAGAAVFWLGVDYNVYKFDRVNTQPVGDAMRAWVKANIDTANRQQTHGVFADELWKIFWFFPTPQALGPAWGIYLDIRTGEMGRVKFSDIITASGRVRVNTTITWNSLAPYTWDNISESYNTWNAFGDAVSERRIALGALTGDVYISGLGDGSDGGKPIEAIIETPLKSYAGWDKNLIPTTFETFFKKTSLSTIVETALGWTNTLMDPEPTYTNLVPFDLVESNRNDVDLTEVTQKRFVSLRHKIIAPKGGTEWYGGIFRYEPEEIEHGPTGIRPTGIGRLET